MKELKRSEQREQSVRRGRVDADERREGAGDQGGRARHSEESGKR